MVIFSGFVAFKVVDIQFFQGKHYRSKAKENVFRTQVIPASRGSLYDANQNLLAISVPRYDICMDPVAVRKKLFDAEGKDLAKELSKTFGKSESYYYRKIAKARKENDKYIVLARNVDYNTYLKIKKFPVFRKGYRGGLIVSSKTVRAYPMGQIAKRTVGYERKGEEGNYKGVGLESAYGSFLRGTDGKRLVQRLGNGKYKPIKSDIEEAPLDGYDLVSTIDINMQDILHHALLKQLKKYEAHHGCAILMEVETGEVKAITNLTKQKSGKYLEDYNYAVGESHEPGSTFKLLSTLALLERDKVDTTQVVDTEKGRVKFYDRVVPDSHRGGYGKISLAKAFEVSSNTAYAKLINEAFKKDPKELLEYFEDIKLNEKLGVSIRGEKAPLLPDPDNKKRWYGTTLPWMAFGYGVSMTPLQTLAYYNAVANKGVLVKPRFIKEFQNWNTVEQEEAKTETITTICSEENASKMRMLMQKTVERGTAKNIYNKQVSMAGKTGTCQKYYYVKGRALEYIASFAGFFPVENPKYSCVVVIHEPNKKKGYYGSTVAAPVFKDVASKIHVSNHDAKNISLANSKYTGLANYEKYDLLSDKYKTIMPNVKGMELMDVLPLLENLGLKVKVSGSGRVKNQSISPGEKIGKRKQVTVELS